MQYGIVTKIIDRGYAKTFVIEPAREYGQHSFLPFQAGQYLTIYQKIGSAVVGKPYSICASPMDVSDPEKASYTVMIERNPDGYYSSHALDYWKVGTHLGLSEPRGNFVYDAETDPVHLIALAGGSGITPFYSMAAAIADGSANFDLTILYGNDLYDRILLREELKTIEQRSGGKVHVVHVLSNEIHADCEYGMISADLIRKYAPDSDYALWICGPKSMYEFLHQELKKIELPAERIRFEVPGEYGDPSFDPDYPQSEIGKTRTVVISQNGCEIKLFCPYNQSLLQAIERAGIFMDVGCRSGVCGWCGCELLSGEVFVPKSRRVDPISWEKQNKIHPCISYPLSDVVLKLPENINFHYEYLD